MKRWKKFRLLKEFGLCEVLSQIEAMATGTMTRSGDPVLLFVPFLKNKAYVPIRFIKDGQLAAATMVRQDTIENVQMLTAEERAAWLTQSLELRSEWKAREAEQKEPALA